METAHTLICNNTLSILAGSETFTFALSVELKRKGWQVTCYSRRIGRVATCLKSKGIVCIDNLSSLGFIPTVIHAHHAVGFDAHKYFPGVPVVFVSHGIIDEERPKFVPDVLVVVSEETKEKLEYLQFDVDAIIRNAVDTKRFNFSPVRPNGKRVLFVSNYAGGREASMVERACNKIGASFNRMGFQFGFQTWDVEKVYFNADVVVGLGRTVLEAMSMGRNAVVFDAGHPIAGVPQLRGDGLVTPDNYENLRQCNFSGRWSLRAATIAHMKTKQVLSPPVITSQWLSEEIGKATEENGRWGAEIVRQEHDIEKAAGRYVELYEKAIRDGSQQENA